MVVFFWQWDNIGWLQAWQDEGLGQWSVEDPGEDPSQWVSTLPENPLGHSIWSGGLPGIHCPQCSPHLMLLMLEMLQFSGQAAIALVPTTLNHKKKWFRSSATMVLLVSNGVISTNMTEPLYNCFSYGRSQAESRQASTMICTGFAVVITGTSRDWKATSEGCRSPIG